VATSYWLERLPRLERFVRAVNLEGSRFSPPIASEGDPSRHAFIAEVAFEMFRGDVAGHPATLAQAEANVTKRISSSAEASVEIAEANAEEREEVYKLRKALSEFVSDHWPEKVIVNPRIAGCGTIDHAAADLLVERRPVHGPFGTELERASKLLFEVKSVERPFRAADFRQLIIYASLMSAEGRAPDAVGLVNPRRGTYFESSLNELAMDTAGTSADDLLQQVVYDISVPETSQ
jgi:hypothetical protein